MKEIMGSREGVFPGEKAAMKLVNKVMVIGLDGFPYTLARRFIAEGLMPNLSNLLLEGDLIQMESVLPTVSGVAWAAFQTGRNPGDFGIFGFSDLDRNLNLLLPNASDLRAKTIYEYASEQGIRVISLGVPNTYPPRPVNGIVVGDFISPSMEKAVFPASALSKLQRNGYIMDINPAKARESLDYFKEENLRVFEGRVKTLFSLWDTEQWDLFVMHFMDTDRINHFLFRFWDSEESQNLNKRYFIDFYRRIDGLLGEIKAKLTSDIQLIVLSDHGFCRVKAEVQLNSWLASRGYLEYSRPPAHELDFPALSPNSKAFALVPGRIHILREGAWKNGSVPSADYESVRNSIISDLKNFKSQNGDAICKQILRKEDAFRGNCLEKAPDIVIDPHDGYDFKAGLGKREIFTSSPISGMHTYSDAMLYIRGIRSYAKRPVIWDLAPTILRLQGIPIPEGLEGVALM